MPVGWLVGDTEGSLDELMDGDALIATDGKPEGDKLGSLVDKYDGNAEGFEDCCIVGSSEGVTVGAAEGRFVGDIDGASEVGVTVIIGFVMSSSSSSSKSKSSISFDILNSSCRGVNSCCSSITLTNPADEYSSLSNLPFDRVLLTFVLLDKFSANAATGKKHSCPIQTFIVKVVTSLILYSRIV